MAPPTGTALVNLSGLAVAVDRCMFRFFAHAAAIAVIWLSFSFAMFLGLQVRPSYGNMGLAATAVLAAVYVYFGFFRK